MIKVLISNRKSKIYMWRVLFNKKAMRSLSMAATLILVAVLVGYYAHHFNRNKKYTQLLNKIISEKISAIDQQLVSLSLSFGHDFLRHSTGKHFCDQGISFLVYHHDELVYWSNNSTPVSYFYDPDIFEN
ncbi:MAG TPA: hypothetical protein ENN08_00575, partial [Bacteroidales bacterium]|nr:hypothetical protein [Bacteroidales bacterium]